MKKEEVELVLPLFEGAVESRRIKKKSLKNWLVTSFPVHVILLLNVIFNLLFSDEFI